ncbi:MAG: HK97 family phage prohead protease [Bacillota bacterium]
MDQEKRKTEIQQRSSRVTEFRAIENDGVRSIEAYFAVFSDIYEIFPGYTESVDAHAFDSTINDDIRCLVNHDTTRVLGRTKPGTLRLSIDNYGLKGVVDINDDDQDAVNQYARVKRGDVSQCSFGFEILSEEVEVRPDGSVHWTLKSVKLYEVSIVTFPAYEKTEAVARSRMEQAFEIWKKRMKARLKHGTETTT